MKREDIHWLDDENEQPEEETINTQEETPAPAPADPLDIPSTPKSRKKAWLVILIVLCIACIGAFLLSDTFYSMVHHQTTYTLDHTDTSLEYTSDGVTGVYPFQDVFLRVNSGGVQAVDTDGNIHWDVPYTMSSPTLSEAGDYAAIADLKGNTIRILNASGQVGTITAEGPISYCTISKNGNVGVIISRSDSSIITVYDRSGNVLVRRETYVSQDGIPVAMALNDDGTRMATSYIIYTETDLRSAVTLFNLTNDTAQTADKIAGNYSYTDTLITELRYMDDMLMYIGDNRIGGIRVTGNTEQVWEDSLAYRILALDFGSDFLAVLFGESMAGTSVGADSNLILYTSDGARLLEMNIESPETLNVTEDMIVYLDGITYNAIDTAGVRQWYYTPGNALLQLFAMGKKHAVSVTANTIDVMKVTGLDELND